MRFFSLVLILFTSLMLGFSKKPAPPPEVIEVLDGDTLKLKSGQLVRLIGVDCPELDATLKDKVKSAQANIPASVYDSYRLKAKEYVENFLKRGNLRLQTDPQHKAVEHKDHKGRMLVYLYAGDVMLNEALLDAGICKRQIEIRHENAESFRALEEKARENKLGLWSEANSL